MSPLPRELVRWIQTLDLPIAIRQPKRDLSNGYLFAEMCARYWNGVELHGFENKLSKVNKEANWKLLRRYFTKNGFAPDEATIAGVINCDDGAAEQFLFTLYTALTKREIQVFPPASEPEVEQIPAFIKQQIVVSDRPKAMSNAHAQQEEEAQRQAEERAKQEAQRKAAEVQQRQQQQSKPKTLTKAQAIQSADKEDEDGHVHHAVQFSSVTVKPLPPQLLSRFGSVAKLGQESGGDDDNSRSNAANAVAAGGGGVIGAISTILSTALQESGQPLWATSASCPTMVEYFVKNQHTIEAPLRNALWSLLIAKCDAIAAVVVKKPTDFASITELLQTQLSTVPPPPSPQAAEQSSSSSVMAVKFYTSVVSVISSTSPACALSGMKDAFLPIVRRQAPLCARSAEYFADILSSFIHVIGGATPVFAATFFSSLYEGLVSGSSPAGDENGASRGRAMSRRDFLLVLYYVIQVFSRRRRPAMRGAESDADSAVPSASSLDDQCASIAYYNAVAGLFSESPVERLCGVRLLTRLVELGAARYVLDNRHLEELIVAFCRGTMFGESTTASIVFMQLLNEVCEHTKRGFVLSEAQMKAMARATRTLCDSVVVTPTLANSSNPATVSRVLLSPLAKQYAVGTILKLTSMFDIADAEAQACLGQLTRLMITPEFSHTAPSLFIPASTSSAAVVLCDLPLIGSVQVTSVFRAACPLRLALSIMQATESKESSSSSSVTIAGGDAKESGKGKGTAAASSSTQSVARVASKILKAGDASELNTSRLMWIHELFVSHEGGTLSTETHGSLSDEELVTNWWSFVKSLEGTISLALHTAEILTGQRTAAASNPKVAAQLPSDEVTQTIFQSAALAQGILIRCYVDFSGSVHPPQSAEGYLDLKSDPQTATRAVEWFNQVVVGA